MNQYLITYKTDCILVGGVPYKEIETIVVENYSFTLNDVEQFQLNMENDMKKVMTDAMQISIKVIAVSKLDKE